MNLKQNPRFYEKLRAYLLCDAVDEIKKEEGNIEGVYVTLQVSKKRKKAA
jgi:hypothetical protein